GEFSDTQSGPAGNADQLATIAKQAGVRIITLGFDTTDCPGGGGGLDQSQLMSVASSDGDYHNVATANALPAIYLSIFQQLCLGYQRPLVQVNPNMTVLETTSVSLSGSTYGGYGRTFTPTT